MRTLAMLLNVCLLLGLLYFLVDKGAPKEEELLLVVLCFAAPLASLIALYLGAGKGGRGLVSLYFERKKLEEQRRIDQLRPRNE
jgi:hypothetical protein